MAKNNLKITQTDIEKLYIKGVVSEDGTYITYEQNDGTPVDVEISRLLQSFANQEITLSATTKDETELEMDSFD